MRFLKKNNNKENLCQMPINWESLLKAESRWSKKNFEKKCFYLRYFRKNIKMKMINFYANFWGTFDARMMMMTKWQWILWFLYFKIGVYLSLGFTQFYFKYYYTYYCSFRNFMTYKLAYNLKLYKLMVLKIVFWIFSVFKICKRGIRLDFMMTFDCVSNNFFFVFPGFPYKNFIKNFYSCRKISGEFLNKYSLQILRQ